MSVVFSMDDFIPNDLSTEDRIRAHVPDNAPILLSELAAMAGMHKGTIRNKVPEMPDLRFGYVKVNGRWKSAVARVAGSEGLARGD